MRAVRIGQFDALALHIRDQIPIRGPDSFLRGNVAEAARGSPLDRPQPKRGLFSTASQLADQELRVVGRQIEDSRIVKGRGRTLNAATFYGGLHQVPAGDILHHEVDGDSLSDTLSPN